MPVSEFYNGYSAIVAHDSTDHPFIFDALYTGTAGNVAVVTTGGIAVTFVAVPAGAILRVQGRRVNSTNTTASNIVALKKA